MKDLVVVSLAKVVNLQKEEISNLIETPPSQELGDYAFPCFVLVKIYKKNPNEIAQEIARKIKSKYFEKIEVKGPYINFFIDKKILAETILKKIIKEKDDFGKRKIKEKVVIESPGPNTNKPLHIGHARNIILAQSIKKILEFYGGEVKLSDIINDRGMHICKSMLAYEKFGENLTPEKVKKKSDHFVGDFYVKYSEEEKKNPQIKEEVEECLRKWESNDKKTLSLWKKMNSWALKGFGETYKKFDLKIDKTYFESKVYKDGKKIVLEQLKKEKLKKKQDGAIYADLKTKGLGEKIVLRTDGTSIYITQDIGLAVLRKKEMKFDRMIYVVANEQDYHFQALFEILKMFGYKWANKLRHLSYGLVHLESGRMKSREGTVVDSDDLISELQNLALKEINKRFPELSEKEKSHRAESIAMSALRYYFLKVEKEKDITFKPEESISFEGNTGPYLLYTYARAKSILRKANYKQKNKFTIPDLDNSEKALIFQLNLFPEIVVKASSLLSPNLIANYAYQLSQTFNEFYHKEKVIGSEKEAFRLALVSVFSKVLKNSLALLYISTIENM